MNEVPSDTNDNNDDFNIDVPKLNPLISDKDEVDELAGELADGYIGYFVIDTSEQEQKFEDSIEECLTHLEEVCSVLDSYRQNNDGVVAEFVEKLTSKNVSLNKLCDQVDAIEQYIFETNRLLDQLDTTMKELETHRRSSGNRIRQIIDLIPRLSLSNMPRLGLFNNFGGLIEEASPSFIDERIIENENSTASISEVLDRVTDIETSIATTTSNLSLAFSNIIDTGRHVDL